jgi:hypothetical protein
MILTGSKSAVYSRAKYISLLHLLGDIFKCSGFHFSYTFFTLVSFSIETHFDFDSYFFILFIISDNSEPSYGQSSQLLYKSI